MSTFRLRTQALKRRSINFWTYWALLIWKILHYKNFCRWIYLVFSLIQWPAVNQLLPKFHQTVNLGSLMTLFIIYWSLNENQIKKKTVGMLIVSSVCTYIQLLNVWNWSSYKSVYFILWTIFSPHNDNIGLHFYNFSKSRKEKFIILIAFFLLNTNM